MLTELKPRDIVICYAMHRMARNICGPKMNFGVFTSVVLKWEEINFSREYATQFGFPEHSQFGKADQ